MRYGASLALAVCAGCDFPDGRDQTWPPEGTITVVVGTDVDRVGPTDMIAFMDGNPRTRGAYVLRGGEDLFLDRARPIESFSSFYPMENVLAAVAVDDLHVAGVARPGATLELRLLSTSELHVLSRVTLGEDADEAWIRRVSLTDGDQLLIGASSRIWAVPVSDLLAGDAGAVELPAPPESWLGAKLATSSPSAGGDVLAVATTTKVYRATITGALTDITTWETIRDGLPWDAQTTFDLTSDRREEIIGFEGARDACVHSMRLRSRLVAVPQRTAPTKARRSSLESLSALRVRTSCSSSSAWRYRRSNASRTVC